jgi:HEAT repeat protein
MDLTQMHTWPNGRLLQMWAERLARGGFSTELADVRRATRASAPDVREVAFGWLGVHDARDALADVRAGLTDSYPPARVEAARAAALLEDPAARDHLRMLLGVDWPETALNAAAYLADLGDPVGAPVMVAAASSPLEAMRLQAVLLVRAFHRFGAEPLDVIGILRHAALDDPSSLVRREAVYQVAALGTEISDPILKKALRDRDPAVAKAARLRLDAETP